MKRRRWDATRAAPLLASLPGDRLAMLRWQIARQLAEHPDDDLRLVLAEHYRAKGVRSQAARWGITVRGWSSLEEIGELRLWLLGQSSGRDEIRWLLRLPADRPLPPELSDLADPAFRDRGSDRAATATRGGCLAGIVVVIVCAVLIGSAIEAARLWVPRLWQPFDTPADMVGAWEPLIVLGVSTFALAVITIVLRRMLGRPDAVGTPREPVPSPLFPTDLAWSLIDDGHERAGVVLLRTLVRTGRDPEEARRALVQLSRDRGHLDEAGRWGIGIPGLTTAEEQRAFAALVRARAGTAGALAELTLADDLDTSTPEVQRVLRIARGGRGSPGHGIH